jgi:hypothetical protein
MVLVNPTYYNPHKISAYGNVTSVTASAELLLHHSCKIETYNKHRPSGKKELGQHENRGIRMSETRLL